MRPPPRPATSLIVPRVVSTCEPTGISVGPLSGTNLVVPFFLTRTVPLTLETPTISPGAGAWTTSVSQDARSLTGSAPAVVCASTSTMFVSSSPSACVRAVVRPVLARVEMVVAVRVSTREGRPEVVRVDERRSRVADDAAGWDVDLHVARVRDDRLHLDRRVRLDPRAARLGDVDRCRRRTLACAARGSRDGQDRGSDDRPATRAGGRTRLRRFVLECMRLPRSGRRPGEPPNFYSEIARDTNSRTARRWLSAVRESV